MELSRFIVHISSDFLIDVNPSYQGPLLVNKSACGVFDNHKIKYLILEFRTTIRFDEGIKPIIKRYLTDRSLQIEDPEFGLWCDKVLEYRQKAIDGIKKENLTFKFHR